MGKLMVRMFSVYFPDSSHGDAHVEELYLQLTEACHEAKKEKHHVIIGGDFNAEAGSNPTADYRDAIGKHGLARRNARGEWLRTWAETNRLVATNTHFKKPRKRKFTHTGTTGNRRQIDFIFISQSLRSSS